MKNDYILYMWTIQMKNWINLFHKILQILLLLFLKVITLSKNIEKLFCFLNYRIIKIHNILLI